MAAGRFSRLWHNHGRRSPGGDAPTSARTGATQQDPDSPSDNRGIRVAAAIETTGPGASPSPGHVDVPVPVSTQGALPTSSGVLSPALTDAQPTSPEGSADVPVLAHAENVPSDPSKAQEHTNHIRRFRILVMGRTNAGKTTILQRVCNTTEQPEIFNGKGERVGPTVVEGRQQRDYRNIEDELVFRSNAKIVFHDSRGFEAGSEEQFKMMKKFVTDRANTSKLDKRIHAIWFCIPLNDSHRMVMAAERFFDECDTGHVPVIVVLTKADTLTLDAVQKLMNKGMSIDGAVKEAAEVANKMVDASLVRVKDLLKGNRFPPKGYLSLTRMQTEGADCTPLLTCTRNVLEEERLGQLLTSTQQSNLLSPNDAA